MSFDAHELVRICYEVERVCSDGFMMNNKLLECMMIMKEILMERGWHYYSNDRRDDAKDDDNPSWVGGEP